jgi:hypothetical protein
MDGITEFPTVQKGQRMCDKFRKNYCINYHKYFAKDADVLSSSECDINEKEQNNFKILMIHNFSSMNTTLGQLELPPF